MTPRRKRHVIEVKDYYRGELTKLRCWLTGFHEGRGSASSRCPGEDILRQLIIAIDDAAPRGGDGTAG